MVYMGHRRFLNRNHPYRKNKLDFDGKIELESEPMALTGNQVYAQVDVIKNVQFGKKFQNTIPEGLWKKKSIFWKLEYWPYLHVRHCLDGMHIIKNVCESLVGTLLHTQGKTKDGINVRKDMKEMGIRPELEPKDSGGRRTYLPPAKCTLSRKEKISMLECLKSVKVPTGYSSNISRKVSLNDLKLIGMKSHDYHVLLTQLLPVAIRGILDPPVRQSITKLCFFFNSICSKAIDPYGLDKLQSDVIQTVNELEMYFPPSFFDIMVHLTVHLVREIRMCGPLFLRYMYPFERAMGQMKGLVRSRSRPEGSIVQGYIAEEVLEFYNDFQSVVKPIGLPKSRHEGRLDGQGTMGSKVVTIAYAERHQAHLKILQHLTIVSPYVNEHLVELREQNPTRNENWITKKHNKEFTDWFRKRVQSKPSNTVEETVRWLALGPTANVNTHQGYDMNGFTWHTKKQDGKSTSQNSGVTVVAISSGVESTTMSYYGWVEEIWELDYRKFKIPLFKCKWINNNGGVRKDKDGFVSVRFDKLGYESDPFILANKQAMQVFYIVDPANKNWHIVLQSKRHIVGVQHVTNEEEYDHFEELPPFSTGITPLPNEDIRTESHLRANSEAGMWVSRVERKKK